MISFANFCRAIGCFKVVKKEYNNRNEVFVYYKFRLWHPMNWLLFIFHWFSNLYFMTKVFVEEVLKPIEVHYDKEDKS